MHSDILAMYTDLHMHEKFALKNIWCDRAKWIWGWSNSIYFLSFYYLQSNYLQQMQMKLSIGCKDMGSWRMVKIIGNKEIMSFIWLYLQISIWQFWIFFLNTPHILPPKVPKSSILKPFLWISKSVLVCLSLWWTTSNFLKSFLWISKSVLVCLSLWWTYLSFHSELKISSSCPIHAHRVQLICSKEELILT